jgi:hypothetical protein
LLFAVLLLTGWLACPRSVFAQLQAEELQRQFDAATPGMVFELPDGTMRLDRPLVLKAMGAEDRPIVIKARHRGKAVIAGRAGIELRGAAHVVIEGLVFTHENRTPAVRLFDCKQVRITRCRFALDNAAFPRQNWIHISGGRSGDHRIDHNLFEDLATPGAFIAIDGSEDDSPRISQRDRIDYNHFRNIPGRNGGGARAIRLGWTKLASSGGKAIIEGNLFERCNGDEELITIRSSEQTVRGNTFMTCAGAVALRMGSENAVEGNFFFGNNEAKTAGVIVGGDHAKVFNNYFESLGGAGLSLPFGSGNGGAGSPPGEPPRPPARRAQIVYNTWINCEGGALDIGFDNASQWPLPPAECVIGNNIALGISAAVIRLRKADGIRWLNNIVYHSDVKQLGVEPVEKQIIYTFPKVRRGDKPLDLWRLSPQSGAIDAGEEEFDFVTLDIDGQPRSKKKDIGADEYVITPIKQKPLTAADVGLDGP